MNPTAKKTPYDKTPSTLAEQFLIMGFSRGGLSIPNIPRRRAGRSSCQGVPVWWTWLATCHSWVVWSLDRQTQPSRSTRMCYVQCSLAAGGGWCWVNTTDRTRAGPHGNDSGHCWAIHKPPHLPYNNINNLRFYSWLGRYQVITWMGDSLQTGKTSSSMLTVCRGQLSPLSLQGR